MFGGRASKASIIGDFALVLYCPDDGSHGPCSGHRRPRWPVNYVPGNHQKAEDYRSFQTDAQDLTFQLHGEKLRLERWGQHVGLAKDGVLQTRYHPALDDGKLSATVAGLLRIVRRIFQEDESRNTRMETKLQAPKGTLQLDLLPGHARLKWEKLQWAVRGKAKRIEQVNLLAVVVQQLHDLIPIEDDTEKSSIVLLDAFMKRLGLHPGQTMDMTELPEAFSRHTEGGQRTLYCW